MHEYVAAAAGHAVREQGTQLAGTGRAETLSSVFVFASLLLYVRAPRGTAPGEGQGDGRARGGRAHGRVTSVCYIAAAYACVLVGILCKVHMGWRSATPR